MKGFTLGSIHKNTYNYKQIIRFDITFNHSLNAIFIDIGDITELFASLDNIFQILNANSLLTIDTILSGLSIFDFENLADISFTNNQSFLLNDELP